MTERTPPLNLQNATTHTAAGDRALIYSLYGGREGVSGAADLAVSQNGSPNMSVNIAAGRAVVLGDTATDQQLYHVWNDATVNKTISAADPTNPRRDLIVAEVRDHFMDGGGSNDWRLRVITGTPAGSPADPALPNNCLLLARVDVAAAASSITNANITDLRNRSGGISSVDVVCTSTTRPSDPFQGMRIYETDTYSTLVYTTVTTGWRPPWNIGWGHVGSAVNASFDSTASGITQTDVPSITFSVNEVAGRRYRAIAQTDVYSTVAGDAVACIIVRNGVSIGRALTKLPAASESSAAICTVLYTATVTQSITWKMQFGRFVGSGTAHAIAISSVPASLTVEDIGPAANPS